MKEEEYVLYVEDEIDDAYFMKRAFAKAKRPEKLHVATSGAEAIDYISGTKNLPKFVFLDIKMPQMSGLELLNWIRKNVTDPVPIFMLSSSSQERDLKEAQQLGANGYLLKPSNATNLDKLLTSIIDHCAQLESALNSWVRFDGIKLVVFGPSESANETNSGSNVCDES